MAPLPISATILAGGAGTRAGGVDKGLADWQGRPLVEYALARLNASVSDISISANRNLERYATYGVNVVADPPPVFRGPLAGIERALAMAKCPFVLTVAVDVPGFPHDLPARLHAALIGSAANCAVAHDGQRRQVLFALYRRELAVAAAAALDRGDRAVWAWQDAQGVVEVRFAEAADAFANLNEIGAG